MLGPLVILLLTGSAALAGGASSIVWGGRIIVVYLSGRLMDRLGRRPVLLVGQFLSLFGALTLAGASLIASAVYFFLGLFIFGIGSGIFQQNRVAATDMFPADRRGIGVGYLMTANVVGSLAAPPLVALSTILANPFGIDVYTTVLLAGAATLTASVPFIWLLKPDPKDIGSNLKTYYPDMQSIDDKTDAVRTGASDAVALSFFPLLVAFVGSGFAQGNMTMLMSLVSLVLQAHLILLPLITLSVTIHVLGMFSLSVPLGRLTDKLGRRKVLLAGAAVLGIGGLLMPLTGDYWMITFAIFLVGLGWSAANVSTTAMLSDVVPPARRGRTFGMNDVALGAAALVFPFLGGVVITLFGFTALGALGLVAAFPPLLMAARIRESRPGVYAYLSQP